jgi:ribonuclease HI
MATAGAKRSADSDPAPAPKKAAREATVWTDGACTKNGRGGARGGIGVFWGPGDARNVSAPLAGELQTNQRSEMTAVLRALKDTREMAATGEALNIVTDSMYTIDCATKWIVGWRRNGFMTADRKPVKNKDLVVAISDELKGRAVRFTHVRGHKGDYGNEEADRLATAGARM